MLWFTVWTLLVVGTLVGAFFLGRHLYRSARALIAELGRAADVFSQVADRAEELADAARDRSPLTPVDLSDPEPARARRADAAVATHRRRQTRAARHEAAYERWRSFSR